MKLVAVVTAVALAGCSTHYQPMAGPRISTIVQGGQPTYVRDGREYPHGFFGGGLVDAVEGDPEATEAAETYRDRNVGGFVALMVGSACLVGGIGALAVSAGQDNTSGTPHTADYVAGGAILCGLAGLIAGSIVMASGQTYQFDAVNIYNDHMEQRLRVPYYPPPFVPLPPGTAPASPTAPAPPPPAPSAAPPAPAAPALPPAPPNPAEE